MGFRLWGSGYTGYGQYRGRVTWCGFELGFGISGHRLTGSQGHRVEVRVDELTAEG